VIILLLLCGLAAHAGYGDVDADGLPSWSDRALHLWTNAARVEPEGFENDYQVAGCSLASFKPGEKIPKPPLAYDRNLNEAAVFHSLDMHDNDWFSHDSSDGTDFFTRVQRYYSESSSVGENIAWGYPNVYAAVFQGWMCSPGHRENIMSGGYTELGTGVVSNYYTQDFGAGAIDAPGPMFMGIHDPEAPANDVAMLADWNGSTAPAHIEVALDGTTHPLDLEFGSAEMGVYQANLSVPSTGEDCHRYFFKWEDAAGNTGRFPEEGSYLFGSDCTAEGMWEAGQVDEDGGEAGDGGRDISFGGCQIAGAGPTESPPLWWAGLGLAALLTRRRRSWLRTSDQQGTLP
jgi:MYXO-CTERM domain-containing protein